MDKTGFCHVKWNKPIWKRQISCALSYAESIPKHQNEWHEYKTRGLFGGGHQKEGGLW
jgi:hypothetical protein